MHQTGAGEPGSASTGPTQSNAGGGNRRGGGSGQQAPGEDDFRPSSRRHQGEVIGGKYTLRKRLGGGGFGEVWLADRKDPFRRVAVKFLRADKVSEETLSRFRLERQITALLDHPAITQIYDSGVLDDGSPYSVMEFIEGVPLNEYCDREQRSVKDRLELFALVCQGVKHAHQKGLIHRDLSPDNILVAIDSESKQPVPKIIDFGIAKVVDKNLRIVDGTLTLDLNRLLGKSEYMAPEQAEATMIGVDTRADLFSLGVILYELLSGTLPLPGSGCGTGRFRRSCMRYASRGPSLRAVHHARRADQVRLRPAARRPQARAIGAAAEGAGASPGDDGAAGRPDQAVPDRRGAGDGRAELPKEP